MDDQHCPDSIGSHKAVTPPLIYVVEDQELLLELTTRVLQSAGWRVQAFSDPLPAATSFAAADPKPDLLLTDYNLGSTIMNGMGLAEQCRRLQPSLKVIVMSGTVGDEVVDGAPISLEAFLRKPFGQKDLSSTVRAVLWP